MKLSIINGKDIEFKASTESESNIPFEVNFGQYFHGEFEVEFYFKSEIFKHQNNEIDWDAIKFIIENVIDKLDELIKKSNSILFNLQNNIFTEKSNIEDGQFELQTIEITSLFIENVQERKFYKYHLRLNFSNEYKFDPDFEYYTEFNNHNGFTLVGAKRE